MMASLAVCSMRVAVAVGDIRLALDDTCDDGFERLESRSPPGLIIVPIVVDLRLSRAIELWRSDWPMPSLHLSCVDTNTLLEVCDESYKSGSSGRTDSESQLACSLKPSALETFGYSSSWKSSTNIV
eukprot:scaffold97629_cov28-Tisochrysis_lutea.AAC.2